MIVTITDTTNRPKIKKLFTQDNFMRYEVQKGLFCHWNDLKTSPLPEASGKTQDLSKREFLSHDINLSAARRC